MLVQAVGWKERCAPCQREGLVALEDIPAGVFVFEYAGGNGGWGGVG